MREGKLEDRRVTLSTSTDFQHWTDPELIFSSARTTSTSGWGGRP